MDERTVSTQDMLQKIGFMSLQLDVAAESIRVLQAEIKRLQAEQIVTNETENSNPENKKTK